MSLNEETKSIQIDLFNLVILKGHLLDETV